MTSEREKKLEETLAQFLRPIRGIPFEVIVQSICDQKVIPFDKSNSESLALIGRLANAMRQTCIAIKKDPIIRPRPNEVGNDMEPFVVSSLCKEGFSAAAPKTKAGKGKSTGYPDIIIEGTDTPIYIEVKTFAAANHDTTQRSFYLSPSEDHKISYDAHHLLVGFEIARSGDEFRPEAFVIVDLYGLECDTKYEFNSDNRRLYEDQRIIAAERI